MLDKPIVQKNSKGVLISYAELKEVPDITLFKYPPNMDKDVVMICDLFNRIPGVQTTFSCAGHFPQDAGKNRETYFSIVFESIKQMNFVVNLFRSTNIYWEISVNRDVMNVLENTQVTLSFRHTFDCEMTRNAEITRIVGEVEKYLKENKWFPHPFRRCMCCGKLANKTTVYEAPSKNSRHGSEWSFSTLEICSECGNAWREQFNIADDDSDDVFHAKITAGNKWMFDRVEEQKRKENSNAR